MGSFDMNDTYVILTGSKNNAGDYFIKYRAKQLFQALRPDRTIIDYDAWKPFTLKQLEEVNSSKALILMGGPALQSKMRPNIYRMVDELDKIRVPIIAMGIGWKSAEGDWNATHSYKLSDESIELLRRIDNSGYLSSVRDYSTLNTLFGKGFNKYMMTGCPALYELDYINKPPSFPHTLKKISFSMGARFAHSPAMYRSTQLLLGKFQKYFADKTFRVVFHHSVSREYLRTDDSNQKFWKAHQNMINWLEKQGIPYVDISGSAENLINHYAGECLHIGFRVHAHIFMNSVSKPTILLNEDGRGKALRDVIGGFSLDSYILKNNNLPCKVLRKLRIPVEMYGTNEYLSEDLITQLDYELKNYYPRLSLSRHAIDRHYKMMKAFLEQLP
jgi:hypothetical protein